MAMEDNKGPGIGQQRLRVRRSRGAISGVCLILLGIWGALIPFLGPAFGYAFTPAVAWDFTMGRLWLEILPGLATIIGGLLLLLSADRISLSVGGWLAAAAGAWFVVGPSLSMLWPVGARPAAGVPAAPAGTLHAVVEQIGFFSGLGVVVMFFAAFSLGRASIVGASDLAASQRREDVRDRRVETRRRPNGAHVTGSSE